MHDDDLILGLQAAVKQEIIEHYLRERRIIEEEIRDLCQAASLFQGGLADREYRLRRLALALVLPHARERFFHLAGLGRPPEILPSPQPAICLEPRGLTRFRRYRRMIFMLYADICQRSQSLAKEREKLLSLREEINQDILSFERDHDMLSLSTYLCSLDPLEQGRRRILGFNFSAKETADSAAGLSFHTVSLARLGLHPDLGRELARPRPPEEVMAQAKPLLEQLCQGNSCQVDDLWSTAAAPAHRPLPSLEQATAPDKPAKLLTRPPGME